MQFGQRRKPTAQQRQSWIASLNHGQRQRLRFLESRLLWEGAVNRRDICDEFGVTPNHLTREMRAYKDHFPENIWYDETSRSYRPTQDFQPGLASGDPGEYLALLRAHAQHPADALRTELGGDVPCDALRPPEGAIDKAVLRGILQAIHRKEGCVIRYQSFSRAKSECRTVWPHALAWTGDRWHVRAFDENRRMHIDLALTRISSLDATDAPRPSGATSDSDWEEMETIEVIPNPGLSAGQQRVIAKEYSMSRRGNGWVWEVTLRRCLIPYFLFRFRLDEDRSDKIRDGFPLQRIVLLDPNVRTRHAFGKD
ncbi:WYL domain-containing protein [Thioalkalivibrio denitrificans]|uniref:WYL domain-containing protein n=1 Tax=Thioalkalivibrio denitrificans TaxID=108003 RepID=UPI00158E02F4|nr:WYL domain-containing protein [Thioalkalivibrio denitrificans]